MSGISDHVNVPFFMRMRVAGSFADAAPNASSNWLLDSGVAWLLDDEDDDVAEIVAAVVATAVDDGPTARGGGEAKKPMEEGKKYSDEGEGGGR